MMGRRKLEYACPYHSVYCDGTHPDGDRMCAKCFQDYLEKTRKEEMSNDQVGRIT